MDSSIVISNPIVFIIIPNNNGSGVVHQNIGKCRNVVTMQAGNFREGEKIVGMHFNSRTTPMPVPFLYEPLWAGKDIPDPLPGLGRIWGAKRTEIFRDEKRFNWDVIKKIWLKNWQSSSKFNQQAILVEKSPTSPAWAYMLPKHFPGSRFIISIRNPYASVEGIRRRILRNQNTRLDIDTCTRHWIKTAELQIQNIQNLPRNIWFTYEEMCNNTSDVEHRIQSLIPELEALHFTDIKSMNEESISNLSRQDIAHINQHLEKNENLMQYFNYDYID